jgi:Arc/MetJ-type ribon-helix-helix transcriptional regulator
MKAKTSVTLSPEVIAGIDRLAGSRVSRSAFIEDVLRRFLKDEERQRRDARELDLLNRAADALNREAEDVLDYQAPWK